MYSMDSITASVERVDMGPAKLFNKKVVEEHIKMQEGQVDMLIADWAPCSRSLPDCEEPRAGCRR